MVVMKHAPVALAALTALLVSACGTSAADGPNASDGGDTVAVTAAFYPLAYAVERVGGDLVSVTTLAKPGAEPHDVELTPKDVATLGRSDLVVYEKGFQPAVDEAVGRDGGAPALDVASKVDLTITATDDGHDHGSEEPGSEETGEEGHADEAAPDPHFWLDPTRYAKAAKAIAAELAAVLFPRVPLWRPPWDEFPAS
jgi:zinc transport system substrate-binding protein